MKKFIYFIKRLKAVISSNGSIFRTILYNFHYLPKEQAMELPMIIGKNTKIYGRGSIEISYSQGCNPHIYIGCKALQWMDDKDTTVLNLEGVLKLCEETFIGKGCRIQIGGGGDLELGKGSNFTGLSTIIVKKRISFGEYALISWNTLFMDSDAHTIKDSCEKTNTGASVTIGNHVWVGAKCTILKGTFIADNVVVAAGSIVHGKYPIMACVIGGNPVTVLKSNISWDISCPD